ncbi:CDP-alcohol phosphatidyltransferase family protein [Enterococcus sp. AZ103]|uniref:CDP-alcohol phosphatidyltransferase family protein n=1 Tax=Enterococcus sp. AZ103 TaxID=2774628 RepID=UPI003F238C03
MKNLPNILTISRIILTIPLFGLPFFSVTWLILYYLCGLTDMVDGWLARRFDFISEKGAILDSLADFIFVCSLLLMVIVQALFPINFLLFLLPTFFVKILSLLIGFYKFKTLALLHTYLNKLMGLTIFILFPFSLKYATIFYSLALLSVVPAIEELFILIKSKKLDLNSKSIFQKENKI